MLFWRRRENTFLDKAGTETYNKVAEKCGGIWFYIRRRIVFTPHEPEYPVQIQRRLFPMSIKLTIDGNTAVSHVAYAFSDVAAIR